MYSPSLYEWVLVPNNGREDLCRPAGVITNSPRLFLPLNGQKSSPHARLLGPARCSLLLHLGYDGPSSGYAMQCNTKH